MKNILFISSISTQFKALLPVVEIVKMNKQFNPVFYFDPGTLLVADEMEQCKERKIDFIVDKIKPDFPHFSLSYTRSQYGWSFFNKIMWRLISRLKGTHRFFKHIYVFYLKIINAEMVLLENNIKCIFLAEDANYITPFFVKAALRNKIKTIVFPYSFCNQEETVFAFKNIKQYHVNSFSERIFIFLFPKWKYKTNKQVLIRRPVLEALAMEIFGCAPKDPWIYIGGIASKIIVESQFVRDYYVKSGISNDKIEIVGNIGLRNTAFQDEERLVTGISDASKIVVLCSLPPDMKDQEMFSSHREMTEYWIKSLNKPDVRLVVSLHPRLQRNDFSFIEKEFDVEISSKPINVLLQDCDVFIACISATIKTALAYRKIVLNFDMFNFNYSEYKNIPMVITVKSKEAFLFQYNKLIGEKQYVDALKSIYDKYPEKYFGFNSHTIVQDLTTIIEG